MARQMEQQKAAGAVHFMWDYYTVFDYEKKKKTILNEKFTCFPVLTQVAFPRFVVELSI